MNTEIPILEASHAECFACGISSPNGLGLHFFVGEDGVARATWQPSPVFRSYPDRIHGGVIATLLDSAIVHALFARGVAGVTAELDVRYLQKVDPRDPVEVTGRLDNERHGVFFCSGDVSQGGAVVVRARGKFMAMQEGECAGAVAEKL